MKSVSRVKAEPQPGISGCRGTVVRVNKGKVYVQWHGLGVEDEMLPSEIEPAPACENSEAVGSELYPGSGPAQGNRTLRVIAGT